MNIPKETIEKIKADAENYALKMVWINKEPQGQEQLFYEYIAATSHEAGATEWADRAQDKEVWYLKRIKSLRDALEQILHAPVPANESEYMAWFVTAKNVAGGAISNDDAEIEIEKYKEVENNNTQLSAYTLEAIELKAEHEAALHFNPIYSPDQNTACRI